MTKVAELTETNRALFEGIQASSRFVYAHQMVSFEIEYIPVMYWSTMLNTTAFTVQHMEQEAKERVQLGHLCGELRKELEILV